MAPLPRTPTKDRSSMPSTQSETPIQPKVAHAAASAPGHLGTAAKRENMLIDLGQSVPQVPIEWFTALWSSVRVKITRKSVDKT